MLELENGKTVNAPLCIFGSAVEGDVFRIIADKEEMAARKAKNAAKRKDLFRRSN